MRSNTLKSLVARSALAASMLLASGPPSQQQVNLTAGPATAFLPGRLGGADVGIQLWRRRVGLRRNVRTAESCGDDDGAVVARHHYGSIHGVVTGGIQHEPCDQPDQCVVFPCRKHDAEQGADVPRHRWAVGRRAWDDGGDGLQPHPRHAGDDVANCSDRSSKRAPTAARARPVVRERDYDRGDAAP